MKTLSSLTRHALVLVFGVLIVSGQLLAADNDKKNNANHNDQADTQKAAKHDHFNNERKELVRNYFGEEMRQGRCPPGLAKKNNGCNPPGQVKHWQVGQQLQREVNYRVLPIDLVKLLGQPQTGYHYGMVDSDILLLMDGTEMVVDAISNLGQ